MITHPWRCTSGGVGDQPAWGKRFDGGHHATKVPISTRSRKKVIHACSSMLWRVPTCWDDHLSKDMDKHLDAGHFHNNGHRVGFSQRPLAQVTR